MLKLASSLAVAAAVPKIFNTPWYSGVAVSFVLYILTGGWKTMHILWHVIPRDFIFIWKAKFVERFVKHMMKTKMIPADYLIKSANAFPDKVAYISVDTKAKLTFKEANDLSNKVANYFYDLGYRKGDTVALVMENRVEYLPVWIGLSKIGVITALINTNLRGNSLQHCIEVAHAQSVIYTSKFQHAISEIDSSKVRLFSWDEGIEDIKSLLNLIESVNSNEPIRQDLSMLDKMIYIFTSGTTGLPKAAVIRGTRFTYMGIGIACLNSFKFEDILYNTLPLYHTSGGVGMAGACLFTINTLVLRERFSASRFFEDCCQYDCTIFNYIGETCRYLLAQPPGKYDTSHKVRFCTGNGLRLSIWKEFQDRFNIPIVKEFYGATEGNASMLNAWGKRGAVGYLMPFLSSYIPMKIVKVDKDTGSIIRDAKGLAVNAALGEPGELVAKIQQEASKQFDGYVNKEANTKKLACDVFCKGDQAFLTGDIFTSDEYGYFYFQDRTGDTFRWKGENVSTNEVEGVISKSVGLNDVCVYGVEVEGIEGKAGMACIVDPDRQVNVSTLYEKLSKILPPYARPMFIRLSNEIATTGTYKFKKTTLRKQSFDPSVCSEVDLLYYFDRKMKTYLSLTQDVYSDIMNRKIQF